MLKLRAVIGRAVGAAVSVAALVAVGCSSEVADGAGPGETDFDGENDSFVADGKTDVAGIKDGTPEACAVLRLADEATLETLDDDVALYSKAAQGIIAARLGDDGELGTDDDPWFKNLAALDKVKWVGPKAFKQLLAYTQKHPEYACGKVDVQLLAFNDFHGNLRPPAGSSGKITTGPNAATDFKEAGGVEFFATHIKNLKQQNPNTLVVAAGDVIGATPLTSALFHDEPTIESMNLLGLDVTAVGNHEFDEGIDELMRMQSGGCHPKDGCQDGDGFDGAKFKYLGANVVVDATGKTLLPELTVKRFRGARIGFIGMTLEGTPLVTTPSGVVGLTFKDEAETANALVPKLEALGVETIVLLIHEGGAATGLYNGCEGISGPLFEIVKNLSPKIDVVIAGHTNAAHICNLDGRLVTSAASFGRLMTDIDLQIDEVTGEVASMKADNLIVTRDVTKDTDQSTLIAKYEALAAPLANKVVAKITGDLLKAPNPAGEGTLGNVIADAQLAAGKVNGGAVMAFMNPGGIRADLAYAQVSGGEQAGEVTFGEAFTVQPFSNLLVTMTVTGAQLETMLEQQWQLVNGVEKANMLAVSAGFTYSWDSSKPLGDRIDPTTIKLDGIVIEPTKSYRITVNGFLGDGGDGFKVLKSGTDRVSGGLDVDAFTDYLGAHSPIAPPALDRITKI